MNSQHEPQGKLGILVGGGPAPGINGVISAATIEAINCGQEVVGILDGFKWLCKGDDSHVRNLVIDDVKRIHFTGGSILRTARDNPTKSRAAMDQVKAVLKKLDIQRLVTIGGDDTACSAAKLEQEMGGSLRVAHVPKTIDNDLPLPGNMPTFGFQTARHVGVGIVENLMEDARTTNRWYLVVCMGRKAGHLTLGIGKAAGATIAVIAEQFHEGKLSLQQVCDVLEGSILKRRVMGQANGVALVAEGIAERLDKEELRSLPGVELAYDEHGHLELRDIPLGHLLKRALEHRFAERNDKFTIVDVNLGYELRCAAPIPFDCEYVRDLGWGAVQYLLSPQYKGGAIVCLDGGRLKPMLFCEVIDPATGRPNVRMVDVASEYYRVAQDYMIQITPQDLQDPQKLVKLAEAAGSTAASFHLRDTATAEPLYRAADELIKQTPPSMLDRLLDYMKNKRRQADEPSL